MSGGTVPDLLPFFSTKVYSGYSDTWKGFYKVYSDVFNKVHLNEVNFARKLGLKMDSVREAPAMGSLESPYAQLKEENDKVRKKAKREYNESVRSLAAFVKKLDKRMVDMMVMKRIEMEVKKVEERERKEKMDKERLERAMKQPDWGKGGGWKNFKTEKQWKNHEQSKKHKEIVAELRVEVPETETVEELQENIQDGFNMDDDEAEEKDVEEEVLGEADETDDEYVIAEEDVKKESSEDEDANDDEMSLLKKMVSEQKNKLKNVVSREEDEVVVEKERTTKNAGDANKAELNTDDNVKDEQDSVEYDNRKSTGRRRRSKKGKDKNNFGGLMEKSSEADDIGMTSEVQSFLPCSITRS
ncbi:DNAJ heat shock N-terminal domain-containing protein [Raphanus sativus]|nr:DNAJ heat shock N-terminal domain-containing protein [Raphanus sativus]